LERPVEWKTGVTATDYVLEDWLAYPMNVLSPAMPKVDREEGIASLLPQNNVDTSFSSPKFKSALTIKRWAAELDDSWRRAGATRK